MRRILSAAPSPISACHGLACPSSSIVGRLELSSDLTFDDSLILLIAIDFVHGLEEEEIHYVHTASKGL